MGDGISQTGRNIGDGVSNTVGGWGSYVNDTANYVKDSTGVSTLSSQGFPKREQEIMTHSENIPSHNDAHCASTHMRRGKLT